MKKAILKISVLCLFFYLSIFSAQAENVGFVGRNGNHLELNGENFYFSAANQYYLFYESQAMVDEIFDDAQSLGLALIRTWGSSEGDIPGVNYSFQPQPGVYDPATFEKLDYVIWKANQCNIRLIIPLVNNWDDGFGGMDQYVEWSPTASTHDEFYTDQWCKDAYKAYVNYFLNRVNTLTGNVYKNEPSIAIIELANEPRVNSGNQAILQSWVEEMSAYIKNIDSNHLVSIGAEGFGIGADQNFGSNYIQNNLAPDIDICSFHLFSNYLQTYTKLLLHCDGPDASTIFTDSSSSGHVLTTNGNAQIDTAQSQFGGASGLFDGNGDYLSLSSSSDFDFGTTTDFTIDFWVKGSAQTNAYPAIIANNTATWTTGSVNIDFDHITQNNKIVMYFNAIYPTPVLVSTTNVTDNTWHHIAVVRSGDIFYLFIDGINEDTYDQSGGQLDIDFSILGTRIGESGWDGSEGYFNGWLDEFRTSKGVARWTTNFIPPTSAYTAESQALDWIETHIDLAHSQIGKPAYMGEYGYLAYRDASYQATTLYSFDTTLEGWDHLVTTNADVLTQVETPSKDGNGSIEYNPEFSLGPGQTQDIYCGITYPIVAVNYSSYDYLSGWVYLPANAPATLLGRFFAQTGNEWVWATGPNIQLIPGQWMKVYIDVSGVGNNSEFHSIGIQVMSYVDVYDGNVYFDLVQGLVGDLYNGSEQIDIRNNHFTSWLNLTDTINADGASLWILNGHDETGNLYPDYDHYGVYYPEDLSTCQIIQDFSESMNSKSENPTFLFDPCEELDSWVAATEYSDAISVELNSLPEFITQGDYSLKLNYSAPTYNKAYWEKQNLTENWQGKSIVLVDLYNPGGPTQASIAVMTEEEPGQPPLWNWYECPPQNLVDGWNTITADLTAETWYLNSGEPGFIADLDKVKKFIVGVFGYSGAGEVYIDNIRVYNAIALMAGWPVSTNGLVYSSPAVGDINGDGFLELVVGSEDNNIYAWMAEGTLLPGWPQATGHHISASPVLGDIDNDGTLEVVVASLDQNVYAYNADGSLAAGWPVQTDAAIYASPAIGDVNGDGENEIVAIARNPGKVYIWRGNGTELNSWTIPNNDWVYATPALADLDNDGAVEIVVATYYNDPGEVYVYNSDGTMLAGWPQQTGFYIYSSPAVGDIDNDGSLEIIVGCLDYQVYAWHSDGTLVNGWPQTTSGQIWSSPALADLGGDGRLEIAVGSYDHNMYVYHDDGTLMSGWPKLTQGPIQSSPAVADINSDGYLDIIVGSQDMFLYAWNKDGTLVNGWPQRASEEIDSSPVVVDFDSDGKVEIAVGTGNFVYAWELNGNCPNNAMPWPMFRHDTSRTGRYGANPQPSSLTITYPQDGQVVPTLTPTITWDAATIPPNDNLVLVINRRRVIVPNTGSYLIPAGILAPNTNYRLSLFKETDPRVNDAVRFRVQILGPLKKSLP